MRKAWLRWHGRRRFRWRRGSGSSRSGRSARCWSSAPPLCCNLIGGVLEARAIAAMAEVYFCGFAPHNPLGPVNTVVSAHVAMASPNFVALEVCFYADDWTRELLIEPLEFVGGYVQLSEKPGWGIELDVDLCRAHPYKPYRLPVLHHPSGAIADW